MKLFHICSDEQLLLTRGLYLKSLGFDLTNQLGAARAAELLASGLKFDLVLLCHTLTREEKLTLESLLSKQPGTKLLELCNVEVPVTQGIQKDAGSEFFAFMQAMAEFQTGEVSSSGDNSAELDNYEDERDARHVSRLSH